MKRAGLFCKEDLKVIGDYPGMCMGRDIRIYSDGIVQVSIVYGPLTFSNSFQPSELSELIEQLQRIQAIAEKQAAAYQAGEAA